MNSYIATIELFLLVLLILFWFRVYNRQAFSGKVKLDMSLFIGIGWLLYSFFYLLEKILREEVLDSDVEFATDCVIAIGLLTLGSLVCHILFVYRYKVNIKPVIINEKRNINFFSAFLVSAIVLLCLNIYIKMVFGGWNIYFTQVYGEYLSDGLNSLTVLIPLLCVSYILVFNSTIVFNYGGMTKRLILFFSIVLIVIFLMGGNRNLAMMMLISLFWAKFYKRDVNIYLLFPVIVLGMFAAAVNAVARNYGLLNVLSGSVSVDKNDVQRFALAVSEGEFGTMARVSQYFNEFEFHYPLRFGYSYLVEPLVNLIPSSLFPSRPTTVAVEFTKQYWGGLDQGTIGLGFSPLIEAKINFYNFWGIVFFSMGFILKFLKLYTKSLKREITDYLLFGSLCAISLNFFRIDFAITLKFFVLVFAMAYLLVRITKTFSRIKFE